MGKKVHSRPQKTLYELYENMFLDFVVFFFMWMAFFMAVQMATSQNWGFYLPATIAFGAFTAFFNNLIRIQDYKNMYKYDLCAGCGYKNRKKSYFCSKCGKPLKTYLESQVLIYTGFEWKAFFLFKVLDDMGIVAWKNSMRYKSIFPVNVYVFGRDAKEAIKVAEKVTGERARTYISWN